MQSMSGHNYYKQGDQENKKALNPQAMKKFVLILFLFISYPIVWVLKWIWNFQRPMATFGEYLHDQWYRKQFPTNVGPRHHFIFKEWQF